MNKLLFGTNLKMYKGISETVSFIVQLNNMLEDLKKRGCTICDSILYIIIKRGSCEYEKVDPTRRTKYAS